MSRKLNRSNPVRQLDTKVNSRQHRLGHIVENLLLSSIFLYPAEYKYMQSLNPNKCEK